MKNTTLYAVIINTFHFSVNKRTILILVIDWPIPIEYCVSSILYLCCIFLVNGKINELN